MGLKWKFQRGGGGGGGGLNQKTFCVRGMDILWNNTFHLKVQVNYQVSTLHVQCTMQITLINLLLTG